MTRITRALALFVLALPLLLALPARAEVKIGYVDIEKAVLATKDGQNAKANLEKMAKEKEADIEKKLENFRKMEEQLQKQVSMMNDEMKRQKLQEYQKQGMELQQQYMEHQKSLAMEQEKAFAPIVTKLRRIIQEIGLSDGYTIILEQREDGVLYAMPQLDLTAKVVSKYAK
jgi:outer membrane protein